MKATITSLAFAALTAVGLSADYSVFRVCEDKHVIRTSDGAEAGHVEYIVVDPENERLVTTVVTGGVIGERLIALPVSSLRFAGDRDITLTEITRERLVSAPVLERAQFTTSMVIQPDVIERSYTHFGARLDRATTTSRTRVEGAAAEPSATSVTTGRTETLPPATTTTRERSATVESDRPQAGTATRSRSGSATIDSTRPQAGTTTRSRSDSTTIDSDRPRTGATSRERTESTATSTDRTQPRSNTTDEQTETRSRKGRAATDSSSIPSKAQREPADAPRSADTEKSSTREKGARQEESSQRPPAASSRSSESETRSRSEGDRRQQGDAPATRSSKSNSQTEKHESTQTERSTDGNKPNGATRSSGKSREGAEQGNSGNEKRSQQ